MIELRWLQPHTPKGEKKKRKRLQVKYTGTKIVGDAVKNVSSGWQDIPEVQESYYEFQKRNAGIEVIDHGTE